MPLCNDVEVVSTSAQAKTDESGQDICTDHIYCGEDFDVGDLCAFLDAHHGIEVDNDNVLQMENDKEHLVKVKRQLGSWVEVHVDARRQRVTCTCEDYNADRYCPHCATFDVLQFGRLPTTKCCYAGERWNDVKKKCVDVLQCECCVRVRLISDLVYNFSTNSSVALYVGCGNRSNEGVKRYEIYMSNLW